MGKRKSPEQGEQIIYVVENDAMPGLVKVGRTTSVSTRMQQLFNTSVPKEFRLLYAAVVQNAPWVEERLKTIFAEQRVSGRREFYRIAPASIIEAVRLMAVKELPLPETNVPPEEPSKLLTSWVVSTEAWIKSLPRSVCWTLWAAYISLITYLFALDTWLSVGSAVLLVIGFGSLRLLRKRTHGMVLVPRFARQLAVIPPYLFWSGWACAVALTGRLISQTPGAVLSATFVLVFCGLMYSMSRYVVISLNRRH